MSERRSEQKYTITDSYGEKSATFYPTEYEIDAATHSLSLFWPTRKPSMCVIGLPEDEMRQIRHAAENMLVAAARMR